MTSHKLMLSIAPTVMHNKY